MIIGRKKEKESLERAFNDRESQFITIYGRRRVGKTYLVKEFFKQKECIFLHITGKHHGKMAQQLEAFGEAAFKIFPNRAFIKPQVSWRHMLDILNDEINKANKKVILFFDELPWLVTPRSGLLDEIDHFWNNKWAWNNNVVLIACGSSASWILKNIIYNTGGLYNRTTLEIHLVPFTLSETAEFVKSKKILVNHQQILSLYMAIGGVPYYLNYLQKGLSAQQNIQFLFFDDHAPLKKEYQKLFESLFDGADDYTELIEIIAKNREGISAAALAKQAGSSTSGGRLTEKLRKLCDSSFIKKYRPWKSEKGTYYKVIDEFCLFYLYWIKNAELTEFPPDYWLMQSQRPSYYAWSGYAFEAICTKHSHQIIRALGLVNVKGITSWRYLAQSKDESGVQIDLVFPRYDNAITLCEIKYTNEPFAIDKRYAHALRYKIDTFERITKTTDQIFLAMITANGLKPTTYSDELVSASITAEDLFAS